MRRMVVLVGLVLLGLLTIKSLPTIRAIFSIAGFDRPKEYFVLLQNNMELRSSGGFMGSFARIRVSRGRLDILKIEDIYTPDGQLDGHVEPPWPIQTAFGQGWYKLRDSNWDPDFPTAAKTVEWFFEHGGEEPAEGVVAVNLNLLQELLEITGPVYIVDEPEKITRENFYQKTQSAVEEGFFPGSTQKRDFLGKLGRAVFGRISEMTNAEKIKVFKIVWKLLRSKEILVYSHDKETQNWLVASGFGGHIPTVSDSEDEYLSVFENNLGANKANCCVERDVILEKKGSQRELKIVYTNTNPSTLKKPPHFWGGAYVNFLRVGIPLGATISGIRAGGVEYPVPMGSSERGSIIDLMKDQPDTELKKFITGEDSEHLKVELDLREDKGIKFVGFFVVVDAMSSKEIKVSYSVGDKKNLILQKQSGTEFNLQLR